MKEGGKKEAASEFERWPSLKKWQFSYRALFEKMLGMCEQSEERLRRRIERREERDEALGF